MERLSPAIRHLRDLVAIPSVNPMGREDLPAAIVGEQALAEHVAAALRKLGLDAAVIGREGRASVVAEAQASPQADTLLVASHLDTVPVDGMEIDPFDPRIEAGRLYGRGSCDTKAGMAALLAALTRVLERGTLRRNVIVVGEADEELSSRGVFDVLDHLGTRRPDWVLATEPTDLQVIHAHKGVVHARVVAHGRACHSSDPAAGENAILHVARAALAIDAGAGALAERAHPELGAATLSVGLVEGGLAPNIVPDRAELWIDRRTLPGESAEVVREELEGWIAGAGLGERVEVARCHEEKPPLGTALDAAPVVDCLAALRAVGVEARAGRVAFGTDAGVFERAGIPGVVMGPGSISVAHTVREFVPVDEVETMTRVFERLLESESSRFGG